MQPKEGQHTKIYGDFKQDIPQYEIDALARCILPKIQAYFESEEGKKEFERWKLNQEKK